MAAKRKGKPLVVVAGKKPQKRKPSPKSWTLAKERTFLETLAETCNVTRACEAAGVSVSAVYRRRQQNAAFRAAWLSALAIAYQQLELVLLERAFNGTEKLISARAGEASTMREYSNQLGLQLLKMHRDTAIEAAPESAPDDIDEIRERLFNKLERLRRREEARGAAA